MGEALDSSLGSKFDELRARYLKTPEDADRYERTVQTVVRIRQFLMAIDEERARVGMSKAELARRIGQDPSVVRRVLSNGSSNPTLRTILDMLSALNMDVELKPAQPPPAPNPGGTERRSRRNSAGRRAA